MLLEKMVLEKLESFLKVKEVVDDVLWKISEFFLGF